MTEFANVVGHVWDVEVGWNFDVHHQRRTDRDIDIAREIAIDLIRESVGGKPEINGGERVWLSVNQRDEYVQTIGEQDFLSESVPDHNKTVVEILRVKFTRIFHLGNEVLIA